MPYFLKSFDDVLNRLDRAEGFQQALKDPMQRSMETIHALLKYKSPIGYPPEGYDNDPYGVSPSGRLGQHPIAESWIAMLEANEATPSRLKMKLSNYSQHVLAVVRGTKAHRIPRSGDTKLVFFWGDTVKSGSGWGPKGKHEGPPGIRRFKWVDHPGIKNPNPFIAQTKDDIKDPTKQDVKRAVSEYLRETIISAGFREI